MLSLPCGPLSKPNTSLAASVSFINEPADWDSCCTRSASPIPSASSTVSGKLVTTVPMATTALQQISAYQHRQSYVRCPESMLGIDTNGGGFYLYCASGSSDGMLVSSSASPEMTCTAPSKSPVPPHTHVCSAQSSTKHEPKSCALIENLEDELCTTRDSKVPQHGRCCQPHSLAGVAECWRKAVQQN